MEPITVIHINLAYYPGQGNISLYEYTQHLAREDIDVYVIAARGKKEKYIENINGVKVYRIDSKSIKKGNVINSLRFALFSTKKLHNIYNEIKPDILHVYSSFGVSIIGLYGKLRGIKTIYDVRSGAVSGGFKAKIGKLIPKVESKFFNCKIVLDKALGKKIFKKDFYEVPLGVNLKNFAKKSNNEGEKGKNLLHVGTLSRTRNLHNVIKAFKYLLKHDNNLILTFVGDGPDKNRLKRYAIMLKIEERVCFTGALRYDDIPSYINKADIGISYIPITAEYNIQPPLKTLEYMAMGLPTIATNTVGNQRFIKNFHNGILVGDDPESLYKGLLTILQNKKITKNIKLNSRKSILKYDWRRIVGERLIPIYEKIIITD